MGIAQKINMVPLFVAMGFGQGIVPLISYNFASGNTDRMKKTLVFSLKVAVSFMTIVSVSYYFTASLLTTAFMENAIIVQYGTRFLRGLCLGIPFLCVDFLAIGVFQACGFGKNAFVFAVLRKIILEIPALCILNALFPLYGLAYAQLTAELILSIAAGISLVRLFRKTEKENGKKV